MTITKIVDVYNPDKTWVIKRTKSSNFYVAQEIKGIRHAKRFVRMTKRQLMEIGLTSF